MLSDSKFRGHRGAVDGGERGRRGGTIGRNRNKLTALITPRLNQTFPRTVSNRHRMATDPLFPTEAKLLTRKRLFTSIPKRWIDVEKGRRPVSRWNFQVYTVEQVRAVASIGENRSKLYATVIVHYFYRLFLFPPLLPSRLFRYTYICFGLPFHFFPSFFHST